MTLALKILEESRLLNRDLGKAVKEPQGLLATKEERVSYLERQEAWNLEKTIETIPGVLEARVHFYVSEGDANDLLPKSKHFSASALIITNGKQSITEGQVRTIISGASGTKTEAISVIFSPTSLSKSLVLDPPENLNKKSLRTSNELNSWPFKTKPFYKIVFIATVAIGLLVILLKIYRRKALKSKKIETATEEVTPSSKNENNSFRENIDPLGTIHAYDINIGDLI